MARRSNRNVHRVRWAAIAHFHLNEGLSFERAKRRAFAVLRDTPAAGEAATLWKSYCREARLRRGRRNGADLARRLFEARAAVLQRPSERAADLVLEELEEAGRPLTMRDLGKRTGLVYRTLNSTLSRLFARGRVRRQRGLYCALPVRLPAFRPSCLLALQLANRELTTGDLMRLTGKTKAAVGSETRRRIESGEILRVQSASPGVAAAFALSPSHRALPTRDTREHSLAPTAAGLVMQALLEARGQLRTTRQLMKVTGRRRGTIASAVRRLIEDGKAFRHERGLFGLSPPEC